MKLLEDSFYEINGYKPWPTTQTTIYTTDNYFFSQLNSLNTGFMEKHADKREGWEQQEAVCQVYK